MVIEAEQKSGSFITCRWAKKYNRQVYAIPGSIFSEKSYGTNKIIKYGKADLLLSIDELLSNVGNTYDKTLNQMPLLSKECLAVLDVVKASPADFDQLYSCLSQTFNFAFEDTVNLLATMEFQNFIGKKGNLYHVS